MPYVDPEARRAYQAAWVAKNRADYLAGKSCVKCGSTVDLEVDHIDRAQKVSHRIWSWSAARRAAELAKCQVLCGPHHREKTNADVYGDTPHGDSRYKKCGCDECKADHARYQREWRAAQH
jgi:5-methylcytosine-specific restriction endonuclease McrA